MTEHTVNQCLIKRNVLPVPRPGDTVFIARLRYELFGLPLVDRDPNKIGALEELHLLNHRFDTNLCLPRPDVLDAALQISPEFFYPVVSFPAGAIVGYERPGVRFGSTIVSQNKDGYRGFWGGIRRLLSGPRIVFPTGEYRGERDCALVAMPIGYHDLVPDGNDLIVTGKTSHRFLVREFPASNHAVAAVSAPAFLPHGELRNVFPSLFRTVGSDSGLNVRSDHAGDMVLIRKLIRTEGPDVGTILRTIQPSSHGVCAFAESIIAGGDIYSSYGTVVEIPEADVHQLPNIYRCLYPIDFVAP